MQSVDAIFGPDKPSAVHPKLRFWQARASEKDVAKVRCEVYRPRDVLGFKPARLFIHFYGIDDRELQSPDEVAWENELNDGLIEMGVPAIDAANEAIRFALGLRAAFHKPERRYGDGFFNAVLIEAIRESALAGLRPVAEMLPLVHANKPYRGGSSQYENCREAVEAAIQGRARELKEKLKYPQSDALAILADALAQYLDERFSVSTRRALGWT